jgi:CRISPR-associated protein Cas5h
LKIVSFDLEGDFAAFRDPSVTSNQTVSTIPPKSALIGLIGALIGLERSNSINELYCQDYLDLLRDSFVGIKVRNSPRKVSFFTNHRSLKEAKTKPFKTELLVSPSYTIYVKSREDIIQKLLDVLEERSFKYCPTLGHAYCLARIPSYQDHEASEVEPDSRWISSVILDEAPETEGKGESMYRFSRKIMGGPVRLVLERHLHHHFRDSKLEKRVRRHWIPIPVGVEESRFRLSYASEQRPSFAKFFALDGVEDEAVCLY